MQQLLSLDIQIPKMVKKSQNEDGLKQMAIDKEGSSDIDFKEFLSNLLTGKEVDKKSDILSLKKDQKEPKAKDNTTSLENMLNLVTFLKSNRLEGKFPKDDKQLSKILDSKQALQDFKEVKNLDDILKVAKKYDIKIKKFKFTKDFDKTLKNNDTKSDILNIKNIIDTDNKPKQNRISSIKVLGNLKNRTKQNDKTKASKKEDILSTLLTKTKPKNEEIKKDTKVKIHQDAKDTNLKKSIDKTETKQQTTQTDSPKLTANNPKKDASHIDTNIKQVTENSKDIKTVSINDKVTKQTKSKKIDTTKITPSEDTKKETNTHSTRTNEIKQNSTFENSKHYNEVINKTKSSTKKTVVHEKTQTKHQKEPTKIAQKEVKHVDAPVQQRDDAIQNSSAKNHIQHTTTIKINDAKQSLNSFVNDLKEQIENYKPPLMKIKMTLSPKDLGDVNVNLVSRGNSLQVTINSNANTMALFTQNQAEFKNALVNMGFTNLNMSFNSNNNQNKNHNQSSKQNSKTIEEFNEEELAKVDTVELTIPRYI